MIPHSDHPRAENPTKNLCGHDDTAGLEIERALSYDPIRQILQLYSSFIIVLSVLAT